MEKGGIVFVFAVPLWAIACVAGVLVSQYEFPQILIIFLFLATFVATIFFKHWLPLVLFGFCSGLVRSLWGDILRIPDQTFFTHVRALCDAQFTKFFDEPYKTLISGIIFGGSSNFSSEWKEVFRSTGTMHIVAVSGANIAFVVHWIEWVLKKSIAAPRARFYAAILSIGAYILVTGAPASVVRAGLMALVMHMGPLVGRRTYATHALTAAAALMVLINPSIAKNIGFQFSCLATMGLIIFESPTSRFGSVISETIAATLCILPLEIFYFKTVSLSALIANVIVAPFIPAIMILGIFSLAVINFVPLISVPVVYIAQFVAKIMLILLARTADIPGSSANIMIRVEFVFLWYLGILLYAIDRMKKRIRAPESILV